MKTYIIDLIRDIIISLLIIACIIIGLALIFYDKVAISKVIPEVEEYFLNEEMQEEIKDKKIEETEEVIVTYHIDASDMKKIKQNNEYREGKNHPFAVSSEYTPHNEISSDSNKTQSGFFGDDGTK